MEATLAIQTTEEKFSSLQELTNKIDVKIEDELTYSIALDAIFQAKEISKTWTGLFEDIRSAQVKALDATYAAINKLKVPCTAIVATLTAKCGDWDRRQKQIQRELEIKANEVAKKAAEDVAIAEAAHAEHTGNHALAEAILSTPVPVVPVVHFTPPVAASANLSRKAKFKAEVYDLKALIQAVASGTPGVPTTALTANMSVLNDLAKSMGGELRIPGVRAVEDFNYARKAR